MSSTVPSRTRLWSMATSRRPVGVRFPPPIEERLAMHEDERAPATGRGEVGADDRLPHAGWGNEHTEVMCKQGLRCLLLDFGQMPVETRFQRVTKEALVVQPEANSVLGEE